MSQSPLNDLNISIFGGLIVAFILAIYSWIKRKTLLLVFEKLQYFITIIKNLLRLNRDIRSRSHIAVGALMSIIARTSAAHLFKLEGEELTLDEYGDILEGSLSKNLREMIFIARTKPSDWYSPGDLGARVREYFDKQKKVRSKNNKIKRYIILPKSAWESDVNNVRLIKDHNDARINLYYCDKSCLPVDFACHDTALFVDKNNKKWAIEGIDFDENTIQKYLSGQLTIHIKTRIIDDQTVLNNWYSHKLSTLHRNSNHMTNFEETL